MARVYAPGSALVHRSGLLDVTSWAVWQVPRRLLVLLLVVEAGSAAGFVTAVATNSARASDWAVAAMLFGIAFVFEEGATRIARLQWRLGSDLKRDMTSVWAVAAAIALPPLPTATIVLAVYLHVWARQHRPAGQPAYRAVYACANVLLAALIAGRASHLIAAGDPTAPWALTASLGAAAAIVSYTVVNRLLITGALLLSGARGRRLLGSVDDNLTELSTLCLGGLVAIAAQHQPWLCILALLPMAMLQRGAFVRELETAAVTDPKTGLLNAVGWEHLAQRELGRARRERYDISVLIVDIDYFKRVNDRHGHLVGDQVLHGVARAFSSAVREYDAVGRFGGEEFVAVLPDAGMLTAVDVAERIRLRVNELTVGQLASVDDDALLSVSIGVAAAASDQLEVVELSAMLVSADQALYRAKGSGRNRVCLAGDHDDTIVVTELA